VDEELALKPFFAAILAATFYFHATSSWLLEKG